MEKWTTWLQREQQLMLITMGAPGWEPTITTGGTLSQFCYLGIKKVIDGVLCGACYRIPQEKWGSLSDNAITVLASELREVRVSGVL